MSERESPRRLRAADVTPDEHGNSYVTFSDGTGAVHTKDGWIIVEEEDDD